MKRKSALSRETVLVIAAHPDDEILGCAGTMKRHIEEGDKVIVVIMAEGLTSRDTKRDVSRSASELSSLEQICKKANASLGVSEVHFLRYPDNRMDSMDFLDIVKGLEKVIEEVSPTIVYTHFPNDLNIDHRLTSQAVMTAVRPQPKNTVKQVYFFEIPSSTEWQVVGAGQAFFPQHFVDISDELKAKEKALQVYKSEMRPWPHARSILAVSHLAKWRGSNIGVSAAEAFVVGRTVWP